MAKGKSLNILRLVPLVLAVVVEVTLLTTAHGGPGSGIYIEDQRAGPYVISVRVDTPAEEHGREPTEVSVRVKDTQSGEPVTNASVVAVAALKDLQTGELTTVKPYQVIESLVEIGLYQVILPLDPMGPWEVLVSVWQDSNPEDRREVYFQLRTESENSLWYPLLFSVILISTGIALLMWRFSFLKGRQQSVVP